jgi:hypothetical protein
MAGRELTWRRLSTFSRSYELSAAGEVAVTARATGFTGRSATIHTADGIWTTRPPHLLSRSLLVHDSSGAQVARCTPQILRWAGHLRFTSGESYRWATTWFDRSAKLLTPAGSPIVTIKSQWPSLSEIARVVIEPAGTAERRLGLLTALTFLILMNRRRAAASAASG